MPPRRQLRHFALMAAVFLASPLGPSRGEDCDRDGVDDAIGLVTCPVANAVFLMDTSTSAIGDITVVCAAIQSALGTLGSSVDAEVLQIGAGGQPCDCCTGTVAERYGTTTVGFCEVLGACSGDIFSDSGELEDWGVATAIVAANKNWGTGARIIVPMSDEGPRCGNPIDMVPLDPEEPFVPTDSNVIENAIPFVRNNNVNVIPIVDTDDAQLASLAQALADGGAPLGRVWDITSLTLATDIVQLIQSTCPTDCDGNGIPDSCDLQSGSPDCFAQENECCNERGEPRCADPGSETPEEQSIADCLCSFEPFPGFGMPFASCCTDVWNQACVANAVGICGLTCGITPNRILDVCEAFKDCNNNTLHDAAEIAAGTVLDCNENCIPDACEILAGSTAPGGPFFCTESCDPDCNINGVPDSCDITGVVSCDADGNGVPDECAACCTGVQCKNVLNATMCTGPSDTFFANLECDETLNLCRATGCCDEETCNDTSVAQCLTDGHQPSTLPDCLFSPCNVGACCTSTCTDESEGGNLGPEDCPSGGVYVGGTDCDSDPCSLMPDIDNAPDVPRAVQDCRPEGFAKNRFISFRYPSQGAQVALQVEMVSLMPSAYGVFNGERMYVGEPQTVSQWAAVSDDTPCPAQTCRTPTFQAAKLQCTPVFRDWSDIDVLHVYHEVVVPGSIYKVRALAEGCDPALPSAFSDWLEGLATSGFGDIVDMHEEATETWGEPQGTVDIVMDAVAAIDKFANKSPIQGPATNFWALSKPRADIEPALIDFRINITDVTRIIDAFSGVGHGFTAPAFPVCP